MPQPRNAAHPAYLRTALNTTNLGATLAVGGGPLIPVYPAVHTPHLALSRRLQCLSSPDPRVNSNHVFVRVVEPRFPIIQALLTRIAICGNLGALAW